MHHPLPLVACLLAAVFPAPARAQLTEAHYELGRHLRAFEDALDAQADAAARTRAVGPLKAVTFTFFSGQFGKAGQMLDKAALDLASDKAAEPAVLWARSLAAVAGPRLLDTSSAAVTVKVTHFYEADGKPDGVKMRLRLVAEDGKAVGAAVLIDLVKVPCEGKVPLKGVGQGDFRLETEVFAGGKVLATGVQVLSLAAKLNERVDAIQKAAEALPDAATTERATLRRLTRLLTELRDDKPQETDYPAARLLREAEEASAALEAGRPYWGQKRPGSFYLALPAERGPSPIRLRAPEAATTGEPLPLVIGLHGAGGSENMLFDALGRGQLARLAAERGWLVVATRNGPPAGLIDAVDKLYPVDRKRVFVVGHSMGAAQALNLASNRPADVAAVAALGGGGRVVASEALKDVGFFVGCGSEDFALSGSRSLAAALKKAEVKKLEVKEYAGVEHLTVVQLGLKDVYAFFDAVAAGRK